MLQGGGGIVNHLRRSYSLSDVTGEPELKSDMNRNSKLQGDTVDSADVPRDPRMRAQRMPPGGSHVDLYFPEMDVDIRSHPHSHELPVKLSQIRSTEDISSGYSSAEPLYGDSQVVGEGGNPLTRTASVGATRPRPRPTRTTQTKKALAEEGADDFGAESGWPQAFPPLPLASLFPELFNQESSGLPPQAFLSPEALQLILSNSLYRGQMPHNINELGNEEKVSIIRSEIFEDVSFEGVEQSSFENSNVITEPSNIKNDKTLTKIDELVLLETVCNVNERKIDDNVGDLTNQAPFEPESSLNADTDKAQDLVGAFPEEIAIEPSTTEPSTFENCSNTDFEENKMLDTEKINVSQEENKLSEEMDKENDLSQECFEDASEGEILPVIILNDQGVELPYQSLSNKSLKPTSSTESVASSGDLVFEDSVPDVAMITERESPSIVDRKGKYNKGKAPLPPNAKTSVDPEPVFTEESQNPSSQTIMTEPDLITTTSSNNQVSESESFAEHSIGNDLSIGNGFQESERDNITPYGKRDVSPTPSNKSKKDGSGFSKFLPKSSMGSLFGFWNNESSSGKKSSTVQRSPSNVSTRPPSSEMFYSNADYTHSSSGHESTGSTTPKLRIRQMSHSPSRKKRL
ncbi:Receptor expression-enhancing protein 2 [Homalodisca vitripennis]|nr:Receptor expression-enhancing protein 2 [Homalodisca vitripennis]KAG8244064.1 Receptor expression-enhancing protein 2 [Homalodisca vitripennis]